mgnify:CR=1 FL=1
MSKLLHFLSIFFLTTVLLSQPDGWSATPNPSSGVFIGQATINGTPAGEGDWSAAFDEDGNCAGAVVLIINAGTAYINMPIYGDDSTTPDVDEGMNAGESFILKIWDSSTGDILDYPESFDCWYNNNGAPMGGCGGYTEVYDFPGGVLPDNPFEGLTTPNPSSGVFLGQATIDGTPAGVGDWSAAFDEDGNCAGAAEIILNGGVAYVNMPIYGDDNTTPDVDEGINAGENFVLKLWDSSEDAIMIYSTEFDCWYNNNGAPMDGCGGVTEVYDFQTTIENLPPVAEAGYDQTIEVPYPYAPAEVTLDGSGSSDEDGMIVSWEWTWTGGAVSGETVSASFAVGVHAVTLTVTDDDGATDTDEVTITVNEAPNEAPVADDNSVTTVEDTPIDITLTGSDPEGDDLTYEVTSAPDHGSLSGSAPNLTYSPNADYNGSDSFIFSVSDGEFSDEGTVSITIDAVNDPPVVTVLGGPFETPEETALAIDIEVSDIEGDLADLLVVGDPLHGTGTMVDNGDGSFTYTYTPSDGYVGSDAVIIQAQETETEEHLFSDQVNIQITVSEVNDPPVAEDISTTLLEDGSVDITLVGSDEDTDDNLLSIEIVTDPSNGTLSSTRILNTYTYTPDPDYHGDDSFTYRVFDGEDYSEIATVTITITPVNDAPTAESDSVDAAGNIEVSFDMSTFIGDIESDDSDLIIDLILDGGAMGGTVTIDGTVLTYNQAGNVFDVDYIPYRVSDGELNSSVELITVYNMPGSARPNREVPLAVGDTVVVYYNETVTLDFVGIDITPDESGDFEQTAISIESGPTMGDLGELSDPVENLPLTTYTANYTATENSAVTDSIVFTANTPNDGVSDPAGQIYITINPVAMAPVLTDIEDVSMYEDETETIQITYDDEDSDADSGIWSWSSSPDIEGLLAFSNVTDTTADLVITPPSDYWNTDITVTVTLTDESGLSDVTQFNLSINNVNDAPSMVALEDQTTLENQPISMALNATDIDNETSDLSFDASTENTDIVTVSVTEDNVLILTPVEDAAGPAEIEVWASDGEAESGHITFTLTVEDENDAPTMSAIDEPAAVDEDGDDVILEVIPYDDDSGAELTVSVTTNNSVLFPDGSITFDPAEPVSSGETVTVMLNPAIDANGEALVTVNVSDGSETITQQVTVTVTAVNDAPVMVALDDQTTLEDQPIEIALNATDIDNETSDLSFDASTGNTDIVTVSVTDNVLTLTPVENATGETEIEVWASDGEAESGHITFTLTVEDVNDAPTMSEIVAPGAVAEDGDDVILAVIPYDDDSGAELTVSVTTNNAVLFPDGSITLDPAEPVSSGETVTVTLTPAVDANGEALVTVNVNDGSETITQQVTVTVNAVNDAPVMVALEDQTTLEDQPIEIALSATDIDNETSDLSFDASTENTDIVTVSVTGNVLTLMPVEDATGPAEIEVWASDGEAESGHITFTLTVAPVNDAPVMDAIAAQTTNEETPLMIMVSSSDIDTGTGDGDENTPTYSAVSSSPDDVAVSINDDQLTMEPALDFHGDVTISVTVTDDGGLSDTTDFVLTVTPVNDAPVMDAIEAQTTLEDQPISMALNATDIDNETSDLSFDASTGNTDIVTVSVTGNLLTLTPVENATGPAVVEVWASDGDAESGHITFTLTVAPVNDAPIATDAVINPSIPTINDDLVLSYDYFDLEGDDESGTIITWFKDGVEQLEFSDQLTIPASATACDEEWYTEVTPSDGELFGQPVNSNTVTICDNTPPQWSEIDDQHINEDSGENTIDISGFITDNEQAPSQMTFQVINNSDPDHLGTAFDGYNLLITPLVLDYHSTESIILTLQADDGFDEGVVTQTVNVFIDPVNDAPVAGFSWSAEDLTVTFTNTSADADGDALTHSWDFGDGGTSTEESPTHTYADEGTYTVSLTASDGDLSDTAVDNAVNAELSIGHETMIPGLFALHQNYPNPFNPITSLRYGLPEQALVTLTIYDLMGRKVTQLVSTTQEAGYQSVRWDATDSFGKPVSAGVYLYQIRAGDFVQTRKMVLLK